MHGYGLTSVKKTAGVGATFGTLIGEVNSECTICGKAFRRTNMWVYKRGGRYFCSWTCYREDEAIQEAKRQRRRGYAVDNE